MYVHKFQFHLGESSELLMVAIMFERDIGKVLASRVHLSHSWSFCSEESIIRLAFLRYRLDLDFDMTTCIKLLLLSAFR